MKSTTIKIRRIRNVSISEYIDVPVMQDDDSYVSPQSLALALVAAQSAAGHEIAWIEDDRKDKAKAEIFAEYPQLEPAPKKDD